MAQGLTAVAVAWGLCRTIYRGRVYSVCVCGGRGPYYVLGAVRALQAGRWSQELCVLSAIAFRRVEGHLERMPE